jgi:SAM-dependent methyltransferase
MNSSDANALAAYEAMADTYAPEVEDQSAWNSLYERPAMIAMLPDVRGKRVLDVGCGTGPISAWVAAHGADVTGFDLSPSMIRHAKGRGVPNASFRVADLSEPLSFLEDRSFDVAVASLAFHYLRDWVRRNSSLTGGPKAETVKSSRCISGGVRSQQCSLPSNKVGSRFGLSLNRCRSKNAVIDSQRIGSG